MKIVRWWRYKNRPDRVHYILELKPGDERHLFADRNSKGGLFAALVKES